jgi:outer membrane protein TolC
MNLNGCLLALAALCLSAPLSHAETDLPPHAEVDRALDEHILVRNAQARMQIEQSEQRKRDTGEYEFTLHGAAYRDRLIEGTTQTEYRDWELAIERPLRLPNKVWIDSDIGSAAIARGQNALGDARHEASRQLLQLWFAWQREQAQVMQWQAQLDILQQQAGITEKRIRAGDAPRMELNQVNAAAAISEVSMRQAQLRAALAADELKRRFPALPLPDSPTLAEPQAIDQPLAYWQDAIMDHNHEVGLAMAEADFQRELAARAHADRLPDPTVGLKYTSLLDRKQRIAGLYVSIPIGYSARSANADSAEAQARIAADQAQTISRKVQGDIFNAHTHAVSSYAIWQQASIAADALRHNADLVARAYSLGESSLDMTLISRRQALEATLAETLARLDANESRYRLLLDAHQLWASKDLDHETH